MRPTWKDGGLRRGANLVVALVVAFAAAPSFATGASTFESGENYSWAQTDANVDGADPRMQNTGNGENSVVPFHPPSAPDRVFPPGFLAVPAPEGSSEGRFIGKAPGLQFSLRAGRVDLAASIPRADQASNLPNDYLQNPDAPSQPPAESTQFFSVEFIGAQGLSPVAVGNLPHKTNLMLGSSPVEWQTGLSSTPTVLYRGLYEGVDLEFKASPQGLKYDVHLAKASSLGLLLFGHGDSQLGVLEDGTLSIQRGAAILLDAKPIGFQGPTEIECRWIVAAPSTAVIACPGAEPDQPLIVDPLISASYMGGSDEDYPEDVAVDADGFVYVVGWTRGVDFNLSESAVDRTSDEGGGFEAFVAKFDPTLSQLIFATYVGGWGFDVFKAVTVDSAGRIYATGRSETSSFPTTPGNLSPSGCMCGFSADSVVISVLNPTGSSLLFSSFFGGSDWEEADSIELDSSGAVLLGGQTESPDFPNTSGAWDQEIGQGQYAKLDGWIAKIDVWNATVLFSTFVGGSLNDAITSATFGPGGEILATGWTLYYSLETTPGAYFNAGNYRGGIVLRLSANGSELKYLARIGEARPVEVLVDSDGSALVFGTSDSGINTTSGAYDETANAQDDTFVLRLSPSGSTLVFATYLGGSDADYAEDMAMDKGGGIYVSGSTYSADFPTTIGSPNATHGGIVDGFVAKIDPSGSRLAFCTLVGGLGHDFARGLAVDRSGNVALGVETHSNGSASIGAHDETANSTDGTADIFVARYWYNDPPVALMTISPAVTGDTGTQFNFSAATSMDPDGRVLVYSWEIDGVPAGTGVEITATFAAKGTHNASVIVTDAYGDNASVLRTVTVFNRGPLANAGPDREYGRGASVWLNASNSTDPDGDAITFTWSLHSGPSVSIPSPDRPATAVTLSALGNYEFCVEVKDVEGQVAQDCVAILITNHAPVAVVGANRTAEKGSTAALGGESSRDPDGDELVFRWFQASGPELVIGDPAATTTSVALRRSGDFEFCLEVTDPDGANSTACLRLSVHNRLPQFVGRDPASLSVPMEASVPQTFVVTAKDDDGDPLTYKWKIDGVVVPGTNSSLEVHLDSPGSHQVAVIVSDGEAEVEHIWYILVTGTPSAGSPIPAPPAGFLILALAIVVILVKRNSLGRR